MSLNSQSVSSIHIALVSVLKQNDTPSFPVYDAYNLWSKFGQLYRTLYQHLQYLYASMFHGSSTYVDLGL
jgi:hypothetical protein